MLFGSIKQLSFPLRLRKRIDTPVELIKSAHGLIVSMREHERSWAGPHL